jgi:tetratricopeptide (TPR) repeat protein
MPVPPLHLGEESDLETASTLLEVEAVQLFVDRAIAVRPDFEITDSNARLVNSLVSNLDGLPLAIELAASRVRLLPIETIVDRLDAQMLSAGSVDLPERQRTINGTIAWSYNLLAEPERRLFARLSVFAGGARLEEIESVCNPRGSESGELLDQLSKLVDHSLIQQSSSEGGPRFRMLHVMREYAADRLDELGATDEMRKRHLAAYTNLVEQAEPKLVEANRGHWLDMLEEDHDNLRAAIKWAIAFDPDEAQQLVGALWRFWQSRGHLHEARRSVESALAAGAGEPISRARALEALGGVLWWQGEMDACLAAYEEALSLAREIADPALLARALYNYANPIGFHLGDAEKGETLLVEAEEIYRTLGDESGLGDIEWARGNNIAFGSEDFALATEHILRSIDHYTNARNEFGRAAGLFRAGEMAYRMKDFDAAWNSLCEGLELQVSHRDLSAALLYFAVMALIAHHLGDEPRAVRLGGALHGLRLASGADLAVYDYWKQDQIKLDRLESLTGELEKAFREGLKMGFEEASAYALAGPTDS